MAVRQPNFANAAQYLHAVANEVNLIPNIPAIQQGNQVLGVLQQIQANIQQIKADVQQIRTNLQQARGDIQQVEVRLQAVEGQLQTLNNHHDLLPLRLFNSSLSESAEIRYPPGLNGVPCARNRFELNSYTKANCEALIQNLGLQPVPPENPAEVFRKQTADHLGVPIVV
ncbi:uncharacterized protein LAJ45_10222 [Morchella importuna]|uniref:uncharacterized protein n=1 Tax=Morchella importuna TaxID=1174673 RepID=UPI001E8EE896|nr:uncharacterized protein LAJ45_10222 [Morchella importuna]KAH8145745.1 hypothetical protein LAJ45_10222 [Morchella importuna]